MKLCPCGLKQPYDECCGQYIDDKSTPQTVEQLMRSRYTAYTQANIEYIKKTMVGCGLARFNEEEAYLWAKECDWLGLEVLSATDANVFSTDAWVEFVASYKLKGKSETLREQSHFLKIEGKWFYELL